MADAITIKALQDASLDAKSLEEVVNGNDVKQVTTRLGETYPSVKRALKELFENSGIARRFKTLAELKASLLVDGDYALVVDDIGDANGIYIKEGGEWVKSKYDPISVSTDNSRAYTDSKVSSELAKTRSIYSTSDKLLVFADINNRPIAYFDYDSNFYLLGLNSSVQDGFKRIDKLTNSIVSNGENKPAFNILDKEQRSILNIDVNGGLNLVGLEYPVQDYLKGLVDSDKSIVYTSPDKGVKTKADSFMPNIAGQLAYLKSFSSLADVPRYLLPQQYKLNPDWVDNIQVSPPSSRTIIGAYEGFKGATNWSDDAGVVHPHVVEFDKPFRGYKYWLAVTPYANTNENRELPYVYGSNSDTLDSWELIDGLPQPFDIDPPSKDDDPSVESTSGHLSDPLFTYDPNTGELWVIWRQNLYFDVERSRVTAKQSYWGRKTLDGVEWSDKIEVYPEFTDISRDLMLAPAIIYNPSDSLFYLYSVTLTSSNAKITVRKSPSLINSQWSNPVEISGIDKCIPYHLEAKWVGESIVLFVQDFTQDNFVFYTSDNGINFREGKPILQGQESYKGSFLPRFDEKGRMQLRILYTNSHKSGQMTPPAWMFYSTQSNYIDVK